MLATLREHQPVGDGWAWELKWDGVRAMAHVHNGVVRFSNRTGGDITLGYPELCSVRRNFGTDDLLLDGEIVAIDPTTGRPSFQRLQSRMHVREAERVHELSATTPTTFIAFDALHRAGTSLIDRSYLERREILQSLPWEELPSWTAPPHQIGDGASTWTIVEQFALEGAVAKRVDSRYEVGRRSPNWIKVKRTLSQSFVVGGWLPGTGKRAGRVGSLCIGVYNDNGELNSVGNVGSGFRDDDIDHFGAALARIARATSPFQNPVQRDTLFVEPLIVIEAKFSEWTDNATLRHPVYLRVTNDTDPGSVHRVA